MFKCLINLFLKNHSHPHPCLPHCSYSISLFSFSTTSAESTSSKPCIETLDYLVKEHNFSIAAAKNAATTIPHLKNPHQSGSLLSFLQENGFSQTHIEDVVRKAPVILSFNLDNNIRPKIKLLRDLGLTPPDIADLLSSDPWILTRSIDNQLKASIMVLKNVLGSNEQVCRLLKGSGSGWFLSRDLKKTLLPNIEYLKSIGIIFSQIVSYVFNFPRFFLLKLEIIKLCVTRVEEMGFDRESKMFLTAIRVMSSMTVENWHLKLKMFQSLGFSENDILVVFRRAPQVFAVSESKVKEATGLLLSAGKCDISYIVNHPYLLIYSVERRIKPRLQAIDVLEKKNLLKGRPTLTSICILPNHRFLKKFVSPYSGMLSEELEVILGAHKK